MGKFYSEPKWLEMVRQQEQALRFQRFTREDALALGLGIIDLVKERYHGNAAVCILEDGVPVFSYKMPETSLENDWWMRRKLNTSRKTGTSSLLAYLETQYGSLPEDLGVGGDRSGSFAVCGGCFPIRMADGEIRGHFLVSGLEHYYDHQVLVDAISTHLNLQVPTIRVNVSVPV